MNLDYTGINRQKLASLRSQNLFTNLLTQNTSAKKVKKGVEYATKHPSKTSN